jgi:hypothetical protein
MLVALLSAPLAGAHHSYADFEPDERYVFSGTLTDVEWGNPHILLFISDGARTMRVEWITTAGADRTGVIREQLAPGSRISVTGSRHRDHDIAIMTQVKELEMPAQDWRWAPPSKRTSL